MAKRSVRDIPASPAPSPPVVRHYTEQQHLERAACRARSGIDWRPGHTEQTMRHAIRDTTGCEVEIRTPVSGVLDVALSTGDRQSF